MTRLPDHLPPLTDEDGEVRELTEEDFKHARPMRDTHPELIRAFEEMRAKGEVPKVLPTARIALDLDLSVVEHFQATGAGWQSRINAVLAEHIRNAGK